MAGVYISYPFCAQKCTYCNFASGVFPASLESAYVDRLLAEIRSVNCPWVPETIYLGGGTPSQMNPETLGLVLSGVSRQACAPNVERQPTGSRHREITIEAAPGNITPEKAAAWHSLGINRVSLGVQSFISKELARTGRKHTAAIVESDVNTLRSAGIHSISVDLIAGLPGQTAASWNESLDWIERLEVPHASVYMLEVDDDSRLGREILIKGMRYGASDVPDDDQIASFYETAVARLATAGLARYEISNFARPGFESRHNLKYWRREPYLGFGADAHSFDGIWRWQNAESVSQYVEHATPPEHILADAPSETLFLGLRLTEGIETDWRAFREPIDRFIRDGLLESDGRRLRLTDRGVLLSNEVFAEFVEVPA